MKTLIRMLIMVHWCAFRLAAASALPPDPPVDTIYTRDGQVLLAQIIHISPKGVKYWMHSPSNNQKQFLRLSEVREIRWDTTRYREIYRVWVHEYGRRRPRTGYLFETTDSTLVLVRTLHPSGNDSFLVIPVSRIKDLQFRESGKMGKSILAGAVLGAGAGFVMGHASGDDPENNMFPYLSFSADQKALMHMFYLVPIGAGIGFIIGAPKKTIKIDHDPEKYRLLRPLLTRYSLTGR